MATREELQAQIEMHCPPTQEPPLDADAVSHLVDVAEEYDVRRAVHTGWLLKAGQAAERTAFGEGGASFQMDQLQTHCLAMARLYSGGVRRSRVM